MSDPTPDQKDTSSPVSKIGIGTVASAGIGVIAAAVGASWPGVIALVLAGVGITFGFSTLVKRFNTQRDSLDLNDAGADAGQTAVDLSQQANQAASSIEQMEAANPPIDPDLSPPGTPSIPKDPG